MEQFKKQDQVQFKNRAILADTVTVESYDLKTSKYHCFYFTKEGIYQEFMVHEDHLEPYEEPPFGKMKKAFSNR